MIRARLRPRREAGWTTVFAIVLVLVCASIAGFSLTTHLAAQKEADALLARERAFQAAEAGVDWALAQLRIRKGVIPSPAEQTVTLDATASVRIRYRAGNADGLDQDGNGTVDDATEADYSSVTATGTAGGARRTLLLVMRKAVVTPTFDSATYIDDSAPILDLNGQAFRVSGEDHFINGTLDPTRPAAFGVTSPADPSLLVAQIALNQRDQVTGRGGMPSVGTETHDELPYLMDATRQAATVIVPPGTVAGITIGGPAEADMVVAHCRGDLHLAGNTVGGGILVVDGDLTISGEFVWYGIVLVSGRATMTGGGSTKRCIGTLVCGEEVIRITGTVDLLYSSDAIRLATRALTIPVICSWGEAGNP
jgi:hypothetical protein